MRPPLALLFAAAALMAGPTTPRIQVQEARVTSGAGREPLPGRGLPEATFTAYLAGDPLPEGTTFKAWKLKAAALPRLGKGIAPQRLGAHPILRLSATPEAGGCRLRGIWPGDVGPEDRVVVEAWKGRRRLAWAAGEVTELLRPAGRREGQTEGN